MNADHKPARRQTTRICLTGLFISVGVLVLVASMLSVRHAEAEPLEGTSTANRSMDPPHDLLGCEGCTTMPSNEVRQAIPML